MADHEDLDQDEELQAAGEDDLEADEAAEGEAAEPTPPLQLEVAIDKRSACERHITVKIAHEDIDRYFDKEFKELMPQAQVPGFRPGRAPRKLVENRFRKEVGAKVKTSLLMDSLEQISREQELSAISEPELDVEAVELPAEGPLTFEFDLEVRPEFDMPKWKGMVLEKPTREITAADIDYALQAVLEGRGRLVPFDGAAEAGDFVTCNLTFRHGEETLATAKEETIRIRPTLSFRDGTLAEFDRLVLGVRAGETREGSAKVSDNAAQESLCGQQVTVVFEVLEVKRLEPAQLSPELLEELGHFELEADLRDTIKDTLARRLQYEQRRRARDQIGAALTVAATWDLPPKLLDRQSRRELQRAVLELQRSGFSEEEIRAHENQVRQHSRASTAHALKEHFILERIAEEEKIDVVESDYDEEIELIAAQTRESSRRIRARLEKSGSMDVLRNQIVERKVMDRILEHAEFKEVPFEFERADSEAIEVSLCAGDQTEIPEAKPGGETSHSVKPQEPRFHG